MNKYESTTPHSDEALWDHPAHIIDFVKAVVEDIDSKDAGTEADEVITSLRKIVRALEHSAMGSETPHAEPEIVKDKSKILMPPLEAAVAVLRWARGRCSSLEIF